MPLLPDTDVKRFQGFGPDAFAFLRELAENQTRDWFLANKARYETELRAPLATLVAALGAELARRGSRLQGDPRRALFRIQRDVRFSHDKRPYKTNAGAVLTRDGTKAAPGLLYIHVAANAPFMAAGFYHPDPATLAALRDRVASRPAAYHRLVSDLAAANLALEPDAEALRRLPRGYDDAGDTAIGDALRRRNFILRTPLTEADLAQPDLINQLAGFAARAEPLLTFGWAAIDAAPQA